ncbi:MAG: hypothetical protein JXR07_04350 [Reichenbachiella sp.]
MKIKQALSFTLIVFTLYGCGSLKRKGDPGEFDGNYMFSNKTEAIVFPIYESYEIEFQMFGDPILFFFDEKTEDGQFIYFSDDKNLKFVMEADHKKGMFYEINEPPLKVVKE